MRRAIAGLAVLTGLLVIPAPASADHHFMVIREFFPGSAAVLEDDAFVELQMYSSGQNAVDTHFVSFHESNGANEPAAIFEDNVLNGQNQRTILIGDDEVPGADLTYDDLSTATDRAGGAACFTSSDPLIGIVDCVAWGNFDNSTAGLPVGNPASPAGIPEGQSLTRSIAAGCATLLEASDDTDDSAADFALTAPSPRPNSVAPTEQSCGGGGPGGDDNAPQTTITKAPAKKLEKSKTKVKFRSSEPGSTFECRFDKGKFKKCRSPRKLKRLDDGKHKFQVRATDQAGNTDPTPAKAKFKVV
jgi:hypothetical protein